MGDKSIPERGVLATRSPCRPNPIGITVAEILSLKGNLIRVTGLDALNGTPILDIKPYEEHFDTHLGIEKERDPSFKPSIISAIDHTAACNCKLIYPSSHLPIVHALY
jgi:tRNA (Thr-GGU) A37 N-methylase